MNHPQKPKHQNNEVGKAKPKPRWKGFRYYGTVIRQRATSNRILALLTAIIALTGIWQSYLTRKSVAISEENMQKQLRAYVNLTGNYTPTDSAIGMPIFELVNSGATPAIGVSYWMMDTLADTNEALARFAKHNLSDDASHVTISAKSGFQVAPPKLADSPNYVLIHKQDKKAIYYWGEIMYKDIFKIEHTTSFRFKSYAIGNSVIMVACKEGNEAD